MICVLAASLVSIFSVSATTFIRLSIGQMAAASAVIVRARCVGNIVESERGEIWTITSFETLETWKGNPPSAFRVRLLGGRTRALTSHVAGVPRFWAGEDVVLFLVPIRSNEFSIVSWAQGTFRIGCDPATGALMVTQDTAGYGIRAKERIGPGAAVVRNLTLEEFRRRIEASLLTASTLPASERRRQ